MMLRWTLVGMVLLAVLSIAIAPVAGVDHVVDDDAGPWRTHATIQDAINASTTDDNITVYAGTYDEDIVVNQTVTIVGNGTGETVIRGTGAADTVLIESNYVHVSNVEVDGDPTEQGFQVDASYFTLDNSSVYDCDDAVHVDSWYATVDNCTVNGSRYGVMAFNVGSLAVKTCTFDSLTTACVRFVLSPTLTAIDTVFDATGLQIGGKSASHFDTHTITNCTTNGKPVTYVADSDNLTVSADSGQVIVGDCQDVIVEDQDLTGGWSITIGASERVTVRNCNLSNASTPVRILYSDDCTVRNVTFDSTTDSAVYLYHSQDATIDNVTVTGTNSYGINVYSSSHGANVTRCDVSGSSRGFNIYGSHVTVEDCNVTDGGYGFYVYGDNLTMRRCMINGTSVYGMWLRRPDCLIENNTFRNVSSYGINVQGSQSKNNLIIYNEFFNIDHYAVNIHDGANNNTIHHNNFADNGMSHQCWDDEWDNVWDDGAEGNYWDDWGGSGNYTINGGVSADEHPLEDPVATSAPEKVPELGLLATLSTVLAALFIVRRRPE